VFIIIQYAIFWGHCQIDNGRTETSIKSPQFLYPLDQTQHSFLVTRSPKQNDEAFTALQLSRCGLGFAKGPA
jgi:hypothetical protein